MQTRQLSHTTIEWPRVVDWKKVQFLWSSASEQQRKCKSRVGAHGSFMLLYFSVADLGRFEAECIAFSATHISLDERSENRNRYLFNSGLIPVERTPACWGPGPSIGVTPHCPFRITNHRTDRAH